MNCLSHAMIQMISARLMTLIQIIAMECTLVNTVSNIPANQAH